jgi:hypothetical protein
LALPYFAKPKSHGLQYVDGRVEHYIRASCTDDDVLTGETARRLAPALIVAADEIDHLAE